MKRLIIFLLAATLMAPPLATVVYAVSYDFKAAETDDFYRPTPYEDVYGVEYNYGGVNPSDFYDLSVLPGIAEYAPLPESPSYTESSYNNESSDYSPVFYYPDAGEPAIGEAAVSTPVDSLLRSDGSVGTLSIPSLSITMNAYPGTGSQSMNRGLGHFDDMSGWDGNIGLCGHNRGALYTIGSIKNLSMGDAIQYTTALGTRTYTVSFVGYIAKNDWSYLGPTADNRITLITCLANQPSLRVCIQAVEAK